jgi:subfamily B ATP-binding cassette protein MsbA
VFRILDTPPTVLEAPAAIALPLKPRVLTLDKVAFAYGPGREVLRDVRARLEPGQMVAFIGPSGTGKSTLLNLLMRFYDPTRGAVRLDDVDLREARVADVRRHLALVSQDSIMLPVTVAENIAYGRPGATREELAQAAEMAGAAAFIAELADGYDTVLTEGGQNLSGGQRQRIAIARALVTQAPFLVLDEPTSALDPQHEQHLTESLTALKGLRTIVLVTHRLQSVVTCDQILVMGGGTVVESGSHEELLAKGGAYAAMWGHTGSEPGPARAAPAGSHSSGHGLRALEPS